MINITRIDSSISKWLFLILINKIIVLNKIFHRARLFLSAGIDQIITINLNRVLYMTIVYCHKNIDLHKHSRFKCNFALKIT